MIGNDEYRVLDLGHFISLSPLEAAQYNHKFDLLDTDLPTDFNVILCIHKRWELL